MQVEVLPLQRPPYRQRRLLAELPPLSHEAEKEPRRDIVPRLLGLVPL